MSWVLTKKKIGDLFLLQTQLIFFLFFTASVLSWKPGPILVPGVFLLVLVTVVICGGPMIIVLVMVVIRVVVIIGSIGCLGN